jgi:hypothetical protein
MSGKSRVVSTAVALLAAAVATTTARAVPTVDGTLDAEYGPPIVTQTLPTGFGDANVGQPGYTNGSELDGAFAKVAGGHLYLMLTGNLEGGFDASNPDPKEHHPVFNKLEIFIDSTPGQGQNVLRNDNPDIDFNGLNRMGGPNVFTDDNGNPVVQPGLKFDAAVRADHYIGVTAGGGGPAPDASPFQTYLNYSQVLTNGGGSAQFLGGGDGNTVAGSNGINLAIDNSNTAGVSGGSTPTSGAGVTTGVELDIPLSVLGNPTGLIKIAAFVNGQGHGYISNQVLGPLPDGYGSLAEPRTADFSAYPGNQYFIVYLTLPGDANSNGRIDADDFALLDRGFARYAAGLIAANDAGWTDGDFNGDGVVDAADYTLIDTTFAQHGGAFSPDVLAARQAAFGDAYVASLIASVPEPASLAACGLAVLPFLSRRRSGRA